MRNQIVPECMSPRGFTDSYATLLIRRAAVPGIVEVFKCIAECVYEAEPIAHDISMSLMHR